MKPLKVFLYILISFAICIIPTIAKAQQFSNINKTKGIGIYPGRQAESFEPQLREIDNSTQIGKNQTRNIAKNRKVYHSSSYDYNLTGQLTTDGILSSNEPARLETIINGVAQPKREREWLIDGNEYSHSLAMGNKADIQLIWHNMHIDADSILIKYNVAYDTTNIYSRNAQDKKIEFRNRIICDDDSVITLANNILPGNAMQYQLQADPNKQGEKRTLPARTVEQGFRLFSNNNKQITSHTFEQLRIQLEMQCAAYWDITEIKFFKNGKPVITELLPSSQFGSAWMSKDGGNQWLYVDLGATCQISQVQLYWLSDAPKGKVELSNDAVSWTAIQNLPEHAGQAYNIPIKGEARFVRISLFGSHDSYILSEFEVYGTGGLQIEPAQEETPTSNLLSLNGGDWKLQRSSEVKEGGEIISQSNYSTDNWVQATVPGTVLTSYTNVGAIPNSNYDDDLFQISESFFYSDFWYRREFVLPDSFQGKNIFLNLDGINWKADIWLNGKKIDRIEGPFKRGRIDVTSFITKEQNTLAIKVEKVAHPGAVKEKYTLNTDFNGGVLGLDNPGFHSTIGWDWINTIRGREVGIWNDVKLSAENQLTLRNPLIITTLCGKDTLVTLKPIVEVINNSNSKIRATLSGWVSDVKFEEIVELNPGTNRITIDPTKHPEICNRDLALWWPNGYGSPTLHDAGFRVTTDATGDASPKIISEIHFKQGIREISYQDVETALKIYVNGKRIVPLGGNWGFSEHNLNYRTREYDIAVRYHRDMNFNMIRNWVGQTGDEEFYEACDKYGIMVWQDFWLANPCDGPDPSDEAMFMANAEDFLKRIRSHASIALYCGRNEGYPPQSLDENLRKLVTTEHSGIVYISSSADDGVSGHGPYWAITPKEYFEKQTGKLHTERGMPNVMQYESMQRTFRPEHLWPQNTYWGQHDYVMAGAQRGATFNKFVEQYGNPETALDFVKKAQFVNYNGYRAMYESGSAHRQGLLIWMSHACWPSMTWQCYDYYFDPTAAYFASKKACERLHVQYNALTQNVEVVNLGVGTKPKLTCDIELRDITGKVLKTSSHNIASADDSTIEVTKIDEPKSNKPYYLRLKLSEVKKIISENTYLLSPNDDFSATNDQPKAEAKIKTGHIKVSKDGQEQTMKITLSAPKGSPIALLRICLKDENDEQILPVFYSDNFITLMPGEKKNVSITWRTEDQHTSKVKVTISNCL